VERRLAAGRSPRQQATADLFARWTELTLRLQNARRLAAKLRKAGLQVLDPERIELRGKVLYRVQVGPVLEKQRAEALLPKVNKIAGTKGKVRAYP